MIQFGSTIQRYRAQLQLKQSVLAKKSGITITYLSKLENNRKEPSLLILKKLSKIFRVSEEELFWSAIIDSKGLLNKNQRILKIVSTLIRRK